MPKKAIPKDAAARREYGRLSVALHRAKKAAAVTNLQNSINYNRQLLGMPPREFTKAKLTRKGSQKMVYLPPEEEMAKMTGQQLTEWKAEERRKRKLQRAREKKVLEDLMAKELRDELTDLERRVKELDDGARNFVKPVAKVTLKLEDMVVEAATKNTHTPEPVQSTTFAPDDAKTEVAKTDTNLDQKPKAIKNEVTISKVDESTETKTELFTLDLGMKAPDEFDPIPFDPVQDSTKTNQDFVDLYDEEVCDMFDVDTKVLDFAVDDEFPIDNTSDDVLDYGKMDEGNVIGNEELLFGTISDIFDDSI